MSQTIFYLLKKKADSVPQTFAQGGWEVGGTAEAHTHTQKGGKMLFCVCTSSSRYKDRLYEWCHIHSIHSSVTRGEFCTHAVFLQSLVPPERSLDTWPPYVTNVKFDLNTQMSFLNAAPLIKLVSSTPFSLYLQPWCNPLWLTGLKAPTN